MTVNYMYGCDICCVGLMLVMDPYLLCPGSQGQVLPVVKLNYVSVNPQRSQIHHLLPAGSPGSVCND